MKVVTIKIALILLLPVVAFAYPSIEVQSVIDNKYNYKEWTDDEERMLRVMLTGAHNDVGMHLSDDEQFSVDNPILRARIIKEMFYTEDFSNELRTFILRLNIHDLTYAYRPQEIVKILSDNIYKLEEGEMNGSKESVLQTTLQMLMGYAMPEDVHLIERIEAVAPPIHKESIDSYKEIVLSRTEKTRRVTEWEKSLNSQKGYEAEKTTSFPWWLLAIGGVIISLGFIMLKGKSK